MMPNFCVCVPARNEANYLPSLIQTLAEQDIEGTVRLAVCVNNSDDDTAAVARHAAASFDRIACHVIERQFSPALAHAGSARRAVMDYGAEWLGNDQCLLIATDADCRPPANWIRANLAHCASDKVVGGRIEIDHDPDAPPLLLELGKRFERYWQAVRDVEDAIDPRPWDPAPRHGDHTGASLALSVGVYRRCGGVPALPCGEDRALVAAAARSGAKLVHPNDVWTRASPRRTGRAVGGMASDMLRWSELLAHDETPHVPDYRHWHDRAAWRRELRADPTIDIAAAEQALPPMPCDMPLPVGPTV